MEILKIEEANELTELRAKVRAQERQIENLEDTVVSLLKMEDADGLDAEAFFRTKAKEYVKKKAVDWVICGMCVSTVLYLIALIWANIL